METAVGKFRARQSTVAFGVACNQAAMTVEFKKKIHVHSDGTGIF